MEDWRAGQASDVYGESDDGGKEVTEEVGRGVTRRRGFKVVDGVETDS